MLKKAITFEDLDGNQVTQEFYFNLNKAELMDLEHSYPTGFSTHLEGVLKSKSVPDIIEMFKKILLLTYGERSDDNIHFEKSPYMQQRFMQTDAYSQLLMELATDENAAQEFINGVLPKNLQAELQTIIDKNETPTTPLPDYLREGRKPTNAELQAMSKEELQRAFAHR